MRIEIDGLDRTREALIKLQEVTNIANYNSATSRLVRAVTMDALKYSQVVTHKITGSLARSQRMDFVTGMNEIVGTISLDPHVINPVEDSRPAQYGIYEHARGGGHAFFERTYEDFKTKIRSRYFRDFVRNLPG